MISKVMTASAAALCTLAFVSFASPSARAGEFCNTDSSGIRGCGYATLEQCKAAIAGKMGNCDRDPFYKSPKDALAQAPKRAAKPQVQH
jgi:Protein of unknown function (DUF3551)